MKGKVALCSHSFHSVASIFTFNKIVKREGPLCQVVLGLQAKKCRWYEPMLALTCWPVDSWLTCRCCKCLHMIDYIVLRVLVAGDFISLVSTVWLLIPIKEKEKISALNWRLSNVNMMIVTRVHLTSFTILSSYRSCAGGLRVAACKGSNYEGGGPLFSFSSISLCICRCCYVTVKVRQLGIDLLQNLSGKTPTWPHYWTELTSIWWEYLTL